ncbi:MAG: hypothetical protein GXY08_13220 [Ruminococcus sp.]|nr:hypothetical protein [Ruminococcus sp.]
MIQKKKNRMLISAATAASMCAALIQACPMSSGLSVKAEEKELPAIFYDTFESGKGDWGGRGSASVSVSSDNSFSGSSSLYCQDRAASWNGASRELDTSEFIPGKEYSFSVNVLYTSGSAEETFKLTLQYNDASGKANYSNVAKVTANKGDWVQLANTNYQIPEDASKMVLYVETEDSEISFYIDDAVAAPEGVVISGAGGPKKVVLGDLDFDGAIDGFDTCLMKEAIIDGSIKSGSYLKAADVNRDKKLDVADLVLHQQFILGDLTEWPEPPKPDNKWDDYQETASADAIQFYKSAIKSMGNTYRLTSKLEAAENGAPLTVAYLGGSITEGKKYSSPFSSYVQKTFAAGSLKEVNAGLSGTSSVVGLVRCEDEVIKNNPDIIFLEFSVNDHEDVMYKKCFESLIKKCLSQPNEPAVVVLINRSKGGFSSQTQMVAAGKNFDVPIISMDDALSKAFNNGYLSTGDYFDDEYHPHAKGGQLVADCLAYFFRQAMKTENRSDSYTIPTTSAYGSEYADCVNIDPSKLDGFSAGSFTRANGYGKMPYSYNFQKNSANNPMTFKVNGKGFIVVFKANSSGMGSINVTVNGKTTKISGNKQYTWGGPDAELGYYQDTAGDLDVSIKVENANSDFVIQGIGLIK